MKLLMMLVYNFVAKKKAQEELIITDFKSWNIVS